jgi:hypothetical protein
MLALGVVLTAVIALFDYLTPEAIDFTEFYIFPVLLAAWTFGWRVGIVFGLGAAAAEFAADDLLREGVFATAIWNAVSRVVVFVIVALITDYLYRERRARQAAHDQERTRWEAVDAERSRLVRLLARELPRQLRAAERFARTFEMTVAVGKAEEPRVNYRALRRRIREVAVLGADLLSHGKLDPAAIPVERRLVDLKELLSEAADESQARSRVLLSLTNQPLQATVDADLVRQALSSLIDRGLEASAQDDVTVLARVSAQEAAIEIGCHARELEPVDVELAEFLITANGGRLVLIQRGALRGSQVTIYLPLARTPDAPIGTFVLDQTTEPKDTVAQKPPRVVP